MQINNYILLRFGQEGCGKDAVLFLFSFDGHHILDETKLN